MTAANRFACRAILREVLTTSAPLTAAAQAHVDGCSFCAARMRARDLLLPSLRLRPALPTDLAGGTDRLLDGVHERVVEQAEQQPLGQLLAGGVPSPSVAAPRDPAGWPEALLESDLAQRTMRVPPPVPATSWVRVKESILDQVAAGSRRGLRRHWWIGLLGTAVAAGVVLVVAQNERPTPPTITFQDIASLPSGSAVPAIDFAIVRRGATR